MEGSFRCANCGQTYPSRFWLNEKEWCVNCAPQAAPAAVAADPGDRFRSLEPLSGFFMGLAFLAGFVNFIIMMVAIGAGGVAFFLAAIGGLVQVVTLYGFAKIFQVLRELEVRTRPGRGAPSKP